LLISTTEYLASLKALRIFDARCWLGEAPGPRLPGEPRAAAAEELVRLLDRAGIERAVVFHTMAVHGSPSLGNETVLRQVAGHERLVPGVVLLPDETSAQALSVLVERGVRLASLYPASHGFSLDAWCSGDLLGTLEKHTLPVVIPHTEAPWSAIERLCREHPALPVLIEGGQEKLLYHNRTFYALMAQHDNLRLLLHALIGWRMVDDLVNRFGPERLVFASHLPFQDPHAAAGMLVWSEIPCDMKERIAHRNLEALISGVQP
jgi:predicted TIM-barrel fold metal-dependent hydrolase